MAAYLYQSHPRTLDKTPHLIYPPGNNPINKYRPHRIRVPTAYDSHYPGDVPPVSDCELAIYGAGFAAAGSPARAVPSSVLFRSRRVASRYERTSCAGHSCRGSDIHRRSDADHLVNSVVDRRRSNSVCTRIARRSGFPVAAGPDSLATPHPRVETERPLEAEESAPAELSTLLLTVRVSGAGLREAAPILR